MRWPLQPLQPLQQTQLQPPFGQSVDSLCHPWFTTTNVSYRFPILKLPPPPCAVLLVYSFIYRRKFRSQTSDNMDRWKAEMGRVREEKEKRREEKSRAEKRRAKQRREEWGSLAELLPFWRCQVQKLRRSCRIAAFLMLSSSKTEEVSKNSFVFKLADRQIDRETATTGTTTTSTTTLHYYYNILQLQVQIYHATLHNTN